MRQVAIPKDVYTGSSHQLFDFLAEALASFIREQEKVRACVFVRRRVHSVCVCVCVCVRACVCACVRMSVLG
jgi:hypothetical protein